MKVIYHCFGGSHSSVIAAAVHLGYLPRGRIPSYKELVELPFFDKCEKEESGLLKLYGVDKWGNEIYSLARGSTPELVEKTIFGIARIFNLRDELLFVDTLSCVNVSMRIGGYLSRARGVVSLGRRLVVMGSRQAFPQIVALVEQTRARLTPRGEKLRVGANSGEPIRTGQLIH